MLAAVIAVPAVHWPLIGWWRGEAFYDGRPTSYWAANAQSFIAFPYTNPNNVLTVQWTRPSGLLPMRLRQWLGMNISVDIVPPDGRLPPDPDAIPVLIELLAFSDNEQTKLYAAQMLGQIGPEARSALPALRLAFLGQTPSCSLDEALFKEAVRAIDAEPEGGKAK